MRTIVAILVLAAVATADVSHLNTADASAQVVRQYADVFPDQFNYEYETSNGIKAQESGVLKNAGREDEAIAVQGSNSYVGNDGVQYSLSYVADENGYQPVAAHLPTTPAPEPIPEYIARALEYIRTHPPKPEGARPL